MLVLHFKRTIWDIQAGRPARVATHVRFGTSLTRGGRRYQLRSVVVHLGADVRGHYIAYVRTRDDAWFLCDDWVTPEQKPYGLNIQKRPASKNSGVR